MKIKKLVFFVVIIVLLIILGVFLWKSNKAPDIGLVRFEEFEIEQTPEGKIIRHQDSGLEVTIPSDWEILDAGNSFSLKSPGFEIDNDNSKKFLMPVPQSGCAFNISVDKGSDEEEAYTTYRYVLGTIDICSQEDLEFDCGYEVETINDRRVLKSISGTNIAELSGSRIRIQMPQNNNVYIFEGFLFGKDKEKCEEEFNKILETVKIK